MARAGNFISRLIGPFLEALLKLSAVSHPQTVHKPELCPLQGQSGSFPLPPNCGRTHRESMTYLPT